MQSITQATGGGQNNTSAMGSYDAYFGTYKIDDEANQVAHTLVGSINPANIGMAVYRDMQTGGDKLTIQLETTRGTCYKNSDLEKDQLKYMTWSPSKISCFSWGFLKQSSIIGPQSRFI